MTPEWQSIELCFNEYIITDDAVGGTLSRDASNFIEFGDHEIDDQILHLRAAISFLKRAKNKNITCPENTGENRKDYFIWTNQKQLIDDKPVIHSPTMAWIKEHRRFKWDNTLTSQPILTGGESNSRPSQVSTQS